jgi:hypothetical protein
MKPKLLLCLALVLSGVIISATIASAQNPPYQTYPSLEARIIQARAVFRGRIISVSDLIIHTNRPNLHYSQAGVITNKPVEYDFHHYTFTLTVDEVLKGNIPRKPLEFTVNIGGKWEELQKWADERASFLWFVKGSEKTIGEDLCNGLNPPNNIYLGPTLPGRKDEHRSNTGFPHAYDYDMDMTLLTNGDDIFARAQAFTKKRMNTAKFHSIYLPEFSSSDHSYFNAYLSVPVEPALEITARHLIATPGDFITKTDKPDLVPQWRADLRADGVDALQYFKSAKNIKLLKSLLDSPDFWTKTDWSVKYPDVATIKKYPVRSKAYEVLKGWGIDVPKPVMEEIIHVTQTKL